MNLNRIREKIIEATKMSTVAHHGASVEVAKKQAASRIALLDSVERYEDSYAISQEFCEWITCINTYPEGLKASTLKVPHFQKENFDADELLEL